MPVGSPQYPSGNTGNLGNHSHHEVLAFPDTILLGHSVYGPYTEWPKLAQGDLQRADYILCSVNIDICRVMCDPDHTRAHALI